MSTSAKKFRKFLDSNSNPIVLFPPKVQCLGILSDKAANRLDEMGEYAEIIKENIEYDVLMEKYPYERELIEGIFRTPPNPSQLY